MMRVSKAFAAVVFVAAIAGGGVQAAPETAPAELPPAGFSGNQYVDSKGCVFLRAGLGDTTTWVARLGRDRKPVCGYAPTLTAATKPTAVPEPAAEPAAEPTATEAPPTAKTAAAATPAATGQPTAPAKPRARKPAPVAAEPDTLALVATKRVGRDGTYCAGGSAAHRYLLSDGKRVTRCAPGKDEALAFINGLGAPGVTVSDRVPTARETRRALAAEAGAYRVTWSRGKLKRTSETTPVVAGAGAYVQIGAFADPANADRATQTVKQLGLPASAASGGGLQVVLAGPFASEAELSDALTLLRQNGYADAFARRG